MKPNSKANGLNKFISNLAKGFSTGGFGGQSRGSAAALLQWIIGQHSAPFFDIAHMIQWHGHRFGAPAGPVDLHAINFAGSAQAEVDTARALAGIAVSAVNFADLREPSCLDLHPRADGISV